MMGVEVASRSAKLSREGAGAKHIELALQTIDEDHHLLAQTCGTGRLSVSLGQHGNVFPLISVLSQLCDEFFNERVIDLFQRLLDA